MKEKDTYAHAFRLDKPIKLAVDNVVGHIPQAEYNPTPPPIASYFLLSDGTKFLLSDGTFFLLSS